MEVNGKQIFKETIKSWLSYIEEEQKLSLCFKEVHEKNKFKIEKELLYEENNKLYFTFPKKFFDLIAEEVNKEIDFKQPTEIRLSFALSFFNFRDFRNNNFICPLLFLEREIYIDKEFINSIINLKKEEIKKALARKIEKFSKIELDIFSPNSNLIISSKNISRFFKIPEGDINSLVEEGNYSPIYIFEEILNIDLSNLSPKERFLRLLEEVKKKTKFNEKDTYSLIIHFDFNDISTALNKLKNFLERVKNGDIDLSKVYDKSTPLHKYIFGLQKIDFDKYNKPSDEIWFGHATTYPLSKGQAIVLQKLKNENLIAVQGPPGTGKTTLLLNIVATSIVERTLSIINGKDFNNLIVVSSTARKAVENASRDFDKVFLKDLNFYSGFYLNFLKKESNLEKIDKFIDFLENNEFSEEEYNNSKKEIKDIVNKLQKNKEDIIENIESYRNKKEEIKETKIKKEKLEKNLQNLKTKLSQLKKEKQEFVNKIQDFSSEQELKEIVEVLQNEDLITITKVFIDYFKTSKNKDRLFEFISNLNEVSYKLKNDFILIRFIRKLFRTSYFKNIHSKYKDITDILESKFGSLDEITIDSISKSLNLLFHLKNFTPKLVYYVLREDYISLEKQVNFVENEKSKLLNEIQISEQNLNKLKNDLSLLKDKICQKLDVNDNNGKKEIYSIIDNEKKNVEEVFFYLYKEKQYVLNKELLKHSITFLKNHVLKMKEKIKEDLDLFKDYFINSNRDKHRDLLNNIDTVYSNVSLAFPVILSTLHSSTDIFYSIDKVLSKIKINPIYISFIDEAGMANVHLALPFVFFSEKVISVGDPLQLPPVVPLNEKMKKDYREKIFMSSIRESLSEEKIEYHFNRLSPTISSVYHRTAKCNSGEPTDIGQAVFLDAHRRCQPPIAELFKKIAGYKEMEIKTPPLEKDRLNKLKKFTKGKNIHLMFYDIEGEKGNNDNTNEREAIAVSILCEKLVNSGYTQEEIKVITPFLNQERFIKSFLVKKGLPKIEVGTVHKFQGKEAPVVIFSPVVFSQDTIPKTKFFNSKPNLINVAISRAKDLFIITGSATYMKKSGRHLRKLVEELENRKDTLFIPEGEILSDEEVKKLKEEIENLAKNKEKVLDTKEAILEFKSILESKAKEEIIIITPWVYKHTLKFIEKSLKKAVDRNVKISVYYGYGKGDKNRKDVYEAVEKLRKIGINVKEIRQGTHAKIVIVDKNLAYIGSLNWLSHKYYEFLNKLDENFKLRQEIIVRFKMREEDFNKIFNSIN